MTDSTTKHLAHISKWLFAIVHGLAIFLGMIAAMVGSQADVSLWESRSALIWGGALFILGLFGIRTSLRFSKRGIPWLLSLTVAEIIAFIFLLNFGP